MRTCEGPREMYMAPCGRHCHSGSVMYDALQASDRKCEAGLIGMPRNSPTYGLPVLSSSWTGAHSPAKSICAKAGALNASRSRKVVSFMMPSPVHCEPFALRDKDY